MQSLFVFIVCCFNLLLSFLKIKIIFSTKTRNYGIPNRLSALACYFGVVCLVLAGVSDEKNIFADNFLKAKPSNASLLHVLCVCVKWIGVNYSRSNFWSKNL